MSSCCAGWGIFLGGLGGVSILPAGFRPTRVLASCSSLISTPILCGLKALSPVVIKIRVIRVMKFCDSL